MERTKEIIDFIAVTSCIVESLFSVAGHVLDDRRAQTLPIHAEEQIFLKSNGHLWSEEVLVKDEACIGK